MMFASRMMRGFALICLRKCDIIISKNGEHKMKNKALIWTVTVIQALPVPISLITILGSIISLANIRMLSDQSFLLAFAAVFAMLLAGTYSITYIASTINTFHKKKLSLISFLPIVHIIVTLVFFAMWTSLEKIYL